MVKKYNDYSYVYIHKRIDNGNVFYVGIGTGWYHQRAYQKYKRSVYWNNIVQSAGGYIVEIVLDNLTRSDAITKEIDLIKHYRLISEGGTLCNLTKGGDGSYGLKGELSPNFGKKYSKERVDKMRIAASNISDETRGKMRKSATGRRLSEETKKKLSFYKGVNSPNFGKKHTPEQIENNRIRNTGRKMSQETKDKISATFLKKRNSI